MFTQPAANEKIIRYGSLAYVAARNGAVRVNTSVVREAAAAAGGEDALALQTRVPSGTLRQLTAGNARYASRRVLLMLAQGTGIPFARFVVIPESL